MENVTLVSMFESNRTQLEEKLKGKKLPKDSEAIQQIVSEYFTKAFDSEGEFRQNLTQSEDYILQAAITLLNSQQEIAKIMIPKVSARSKDQKVNMPSQPEPSVESSNKATEPFKPIFAKSTETNTLIGVAGGAIVGKMLMGSWGAVFGAIAGTAIALYLSAGKTSMEKATKPKAANPASNNMMENSRPIDVDKFTSVINAICENVDSLINTYRAQIKRVVAKYEQQEKPTIEKSYRPLIEGIQSLLGYERTHDEAEEKYSRKIKERIEELAELLDNYNLTAVDYDGKNGHLFDMVSSPNTKETRMVYPAIVKNGTAVIPGKVFIPA